MLLRPYQPSDLPALVAICIRTGDAGTDATRRYVDPGMIARYYATPYTAYPGAVRLVLEDEEGQVGYVIGAVDTRDYTAWFNRWWRPGLAALVRSRPALPAGAADRWLYRLIGQPATVPSWVDRYPAHLHIDLLPRAQGRGWGRRMIEAWMELAAARGARGLHLGVAPGNAGAIAFYSRMGLERLPSGSGAVMLGRRLSGPAAG